MRRRLIFVLVLLFNIVFIYGINYANDVMAQNDFIISFHEEEKKEEQEEQEDHSHDTEFNGETIEEIGKKLEKVFVKTDLEGYGEYISKAAIHNGIDPYLTAAIILENTNCQRECSVLFRQCHNVGGFKGDPGCFGGTYKEFDKVEKSVDELVQYISINVDKEKQVPYKIFKSFGKNEAWAFKVNNYIELLKIG